MRGRRGRCQGYHLKVTIIHIPRLLKEKADHEHARRYDLLDSEPQVISGELP